MWTLHQLYLLWKTLFLMFWVPQWVVSLCYFSFVCIAVIIIVIIIVVVVLQINYHSWFMVAGWWIQFQECYCKIRWHHVSLPILVTSLLHRHHSMFGCFGRSCYSGIHVSSGNPLFKKIFSSFFLLSLSSLVSIFIITIIVMIIMIVLFVHHKSWILKFSGGFKFSYHQRRLSVHCIATAHGSFRRTAKGGYSIVK